MPAINPAKLKHQSNQLTKEFEKPERFVRRLHDLLSFYADRTHRPGQIGKNIPVIQSYKVKNTVLNQVVKALKPDIHSDPDNALELCEKLWQENYFETKFIATQILQEIPATHSDIVFQRVDNWITQDTDKMLLQVLLSSSIKPIRINSPDLYKDQISGWLEGKSKFEKQIGLKALLGALRDNSFTDYPMIFRSIQPLLREEFRYFLSSLTDIVLELARKTPSETVYFLNQTLLVTDNPDVRFLIRQISPELSIENRAQLKNSMKDADQEH